MKIFAKKIEMTHIEQGFKVSPITVLDITDNVVALVSEKRKLIGWGKRKTTSKAAVTQYKDLGFVPRVVMESTDIAEDSKAGDQITIAELPAKVNIIGTSKGKGFAGVVKRHGFKGGPKTHGASDRQRAPGSIGPGTTPGRVFKGTRMAGRMGSDTVTIKNLEVIKLLEVDSRKYLLVRGSIPGAKGTLVNVVW